MFPVLWAVCIGRSAERFVSVMSEAWARQTLNSPCYGPWCHVSVMKQPVRWLSAEVSLVHNPHTVTFAFTWFGIAPVYGRLLSCDKPCERKWDDVLKELNIRQHTRSLLSPLTAGFIKAHSLMTYTIRSSSILYSVLPSGSCYRGNRLTLCTAMLNRRDLCTRLDVFIRF